MKQGFRGGCFKPETWVAIAWILFIIVLILILYSAHRYYLESPYRVDIDVARNTKYDVYLDVRTDIERKTIGYYPGSVHIPSFELDERIEKEIPDKNASILVYCNTGHRAKLATEKLRKLGYKHVRYIAESYLFL